MKGTMQPSKYVLPFGRESVSYPGRRAIPRWVTCDAREFERMLNAGELEPCSDVEWERIQQLMFRPVESHN